MVITPNFHFHGDCEDAMKLYQKAFSGEITCLLRYQDANPQDYVADSRWGSRIYHGEMLLYGIRIMMSDLEPAEAENKPESPPLSLVVTMDTKVQVMEAYQAMMEGALIREQPQSTTYSSCFVSLVDRFGIRWEIMTEQTLQ